MDEQFNEKEERKKLLAFSKSFFIIVGTIVILIFMLLNPNRGAFNNSINEGSLPNNPSDKEIMLQIRKINLKDYNNDNHPLVKRRNYFIFSIYDVKVSNDKTYHILGILLTFKLLK